MFRKGNILLVDDSMAQLGRLQNHLAVHADKIFLAQSGLEALSMIQNEKIHCIVCGYEMAGMNGLEVLQELRSHDVKTPFIFYSANSSKSFLVEAARQGAYALLLKPDKPSLERIVKEALKEGFSKRKRYLTYSK
mgnify:FL=1